MPKGHPLPDATRAAIMAALLTGQAVNQIARDFSLNPSVVSRMRAKAYPFLKQRQATESSSKLEMLVFANVRQNLETLTAQSVEAGRPEYIQAQPARELAVLHSVIADKTFRILSAMESEGTQS